MITLYLHLTFNGQCRDALEFYHSVFGGHLHFTTLGETAFGSEFPVVLRPLVIKGMLENYFFKIYGSDMIHEDGWRRGNNLSMWLAIEELEVKKQLVHRLLQNTSRQPISNSSESISITDQFGIQWIFQ